MNLTTIFRALLTAKDEMDRDLSSRAEYSFVVPVTPAKAFFGIGIADDTHARSWQHHRRQAEKFENRIRISLRNIERLQKLTFTMEEAEFNIEVRKRFPL